MKQVIFFRSEAKFKIPIIEMFGCLGDISQVKIETIDIGDNYFEISQAFERIETELNRIIGYSHFGREIYICGAVPLGFVWLLRGFLASRFSEVRFVWLQMARQKGVDYEKKVYEIWSEDNE